jgi:hypothetical protein
MLLISLLRKLAMQFDDRKYPIEVYFHLLEQTRIAATPAELGSALLHLLAWKLGKLSRDPDGPFIAQPSGTRYAIQNASPKVISERHEEILLSREFFNWAQKVRTIQYFEAILIHELGRFELWSTTVMPVFLLHCLQPRIYPIVDRWVLLAHDLLDGDQDSEFQARPRTDVEAYVAFHDWWLRVLAEAGLGPMSAQLNQLKEIDSGLWAVGKRAARLVAEMQSEVDGAEAADGSSTGARRRIGGTDTDEFKRRAVAIRNSGKTQRQAIIDAGAELGIALKPSYLQYPGSHFERWRKQGFE